MNLSKHWETVEDRGTWSIAVHGTTKSWTWLSTWTATATKAREVYFYEWVKVHWLCSCLVNGGGAMLIVVNHGYRADRGFVFLNLYLFIWTAFVAQLVKIPSAMWETWVWSLGWEDPLEKGKATHSSILAWRIPWTVWSMGLQRVGHDWATITSLSHFISPWVLISGQE